MTGDEQRTEHRETAEALARLQTVVRQRHVRYEVWPEWLVVRGERVKVGFNIELFARHDAGVGHVFPGCQKCRDAYDDMQTVADWIIPKDIRASTYEIEPFERVWEESPNEKLGPEVPLTIKIVHRHGFDLPADDCEERCLKEMTGKLDSLGARSATRTQPSAKRVPS